MSLSALAAYRGLNAAGCAPLRRCAGGGAGRLEPQHVEAPSASSKPPRWPPASATGLSPCDGLSADRIRCLPGRAARGSLLLGRCVRQSLRHRERPAEQPRPLSGYRLTSAAPLPWPGGANRLRPYGTPAGTRERTSASSRSTCWTVL